MLLPRSAAKQAPHFAKQPEGTATFRAFYFVAPAAASQLNVRHAHVSLRWNEVFATSLVYWHTSLAASVGK